MTNDVAARRAGSANNEPAERAGLSDGAAAGRPAPADEAGAGPAAPVEEAATDRAALVAEAGAGPAGLVDEAAVGPAGLVDEAAVGHAAPGDEAATDRAALVAEAAAGPAGLVDDVAAGVGESADGAAAVPAALMTIGQLAAETGVPGSTIRFWERRGLLAPTLRQSGQRRYAPDAVRSVAMLRLCQEAGFTLADIRRLLDERAVTPRSWHTLVAEKLTDVERQITALEHARGLLTHASTCHHDDLLACPGFQQWFAAYLQTTRPR